MLKAKLSTAAISILLIAQLTGCSLLKDGNFAIILADTGEIVLTENDVAAYHTGGTLDLNDKGIEKWNSFLTYQGIPKLNGTLYNREFTISIQGKELCQGKFWSNVSSANVNGIVILDSLLKMDNKNHSIQIQSTYPGKGLLGDSISSELDQFFGKRHLLK